MKRILILLLALVLCVPVQAQVGRFKHIKVLYPGYSLKLDTATGELSAVHYDTESDMHWEEVISPKQSHNHRQIGRYEFRRTRKVGIYQIFDTATGTYTSIKWKPTDKDGKEIEAQVDSAMTTMVDGLKRFVKGVEEELDKAF